MTVIPYLFRPPGSLATQVAPTAVSLFRLRRGPSRRVRCVPQGFHRGAQSDSHSWVTNLPQTPGSRGFSIRAERELLPSHASDMLPVRTGQLTGKNLHLQESQPCRPLRGPVHFASQPFGWFALSVLFRYEKEGWRTRKIDSPCQPYLVMIKYIIITKNNK